MCLFCFVYGLQCVWLGNDAREHTCHVLPVLVCFASSTVAMAHRAAGAQIADASVTHLQQLCLQALLAGDSCMYVDLASV